MLQFGSSAVNLSTEVFEKQLIAVLGETTVKNIRTISTIIELGTGFILMVKGSAAMVKALQSKAKDILKSVKENPTTFENLTGASKLAAEQAIDGSKGLLKMKTTADAIKELPAPVQKALSGIPENLKLLHPTKDEITIFSLVSGEVTEIAKIEGSVLKIVDTRILSKLSATEVEKLTQDILDNPALLKAMGDEPGLTTAWKTLKDAGVDDAIRKNADNLDGVSKYLDKGLRNVDDIKTGLSKAPDKQKWLDDLKSGVYRNGRDAEYVNPNGKVLKWTDQSAADIDNSIQSRMALPDNADNLGARAEGKVGDFLTKDGNQIEGFGQKIVRSTDGSVGAELDIITKNEIIEVKNSIVAAKNKFVLTKSDGEVGQAGKLVNKNADDFVNPGGKTPILYIDEPLPRTPDGQLFPSDQAYIDALNAKGIKVVNSLDELKQIIKK